MSEINYFDKLVQNEYEKRKLARNEQDYLFALWSEIGMKEEKNDWYYLIRKSFFNEVKRKVRQIIKSNNEAYDQN